VISSNEKCAFRNKDSEVVAFIRFVGELVHYDLSEGHFARNIRQLRPDLFPPE